MPAPITVQELLDAPPLTDDEVSRVRAMRRIDIGEGLSLAFENRESILGTLRHIVATEGMTDRDAVQAECDVYNMLLPNGVLTAQLGIRARAGQSLRSALDTLAGLEQHVWLALGTVRRAGLFFGRLAARQHVRFMLEGPDMNVLLDDATPVRVVVDLPDYTVDVPLPSALCRALWEDLR